MVREKRMIKEDLYVKNDGDMLGDNPIKQRNVMEDKGRGRKAHTNVRQGKNGDYLKDKGVSDMNLVEESEMLDLRISGRTMEPKKDKGSVSKVGVIITISLMVILGYLIYYALVVV